MHIALSRRNILMSGKLLNHCGGGSSHREMRTERVSQAMAAIRGELSSPRCSLNEVLDDIRRQGRRIVLTQQSAAD